jgi:hypothetical protein
VQREDECTRMITMKRDRLKRKTKGDDRMKERMKRRVDEQGASDESRQ